MGKITLAGRIPGDNNNGLGPHSTVMLDDYKPGDNPRLYNVVARVSVAKIVTNTETGVTYPVLAVQHWELVPAEHQAAFGEIIGGAFGSRTGQLELPFPEGQVPLKDPFPEERGSGDINDVDDPDDELAARRA